MSVFNTFCDPGLFFDFAKNNRAVWQKLIGRRIIHSTFGEGIINEIKFDNLISNSIIIVEFSQPLDTPPSEKNIRKLGFLIFSKGILSQLELPEELIEEVNEFGEIRKKKLEEEKRILLLQAESQQLWEEGRIKRAEEEKKRVEERKQQEAKELIAREEFKKLKERYLVGFFQDSSPVSPLNEILMKLEENDTIDSSQVAWLSKNGLFPVLAVYHERLFILNGPADLASAGSFWRKAGFPEKALEITKNIRSNIDKENSMLLTMRGGAYRDLNELDNAEACGLEAKELNPKSYYPCNLLGAVYFQQGLPDKGDEYFSKAKDLGAPNDEKYEIGQIKAALGKAGLIERKRSAEYLLKKDPEKNQWANYYLQ